MIKILPILVLVILTVGFVSWKLFFGSTTPSLTLPENFSITQTPKIATSSTLLENEQSSLADRVKELEFSVTDLLKKESDTDKIKALQASVDDLKKRVGKLESSPSPTTQTSSSTQTQVTTSKSPVYISLAASGSNSNGDWATISGTVVTIDTADYAGYTSMQFEANIQIFQTGTAYARISNKTDGTSILSSEISTTSTSYTNITSAKFNLPSGKKDYQLQIKSQITGYAASVQNARIKVNF